MGNIWKDGIYGLIVGDALGVPVEFTSREERKTDPVLGMREYGTHHQPRGTWSDDSSMTLATVDSIRINSGIDYKDLMERFVAWWRYGEYTPFKAVFDMGIATANALTRYEEGEAPVNSGGDTEWDNGNGSLMRILPVCLYLCNRQKTTGTSEAESIDAIHSASALTHAHLRSQIACGIYYFMVKAVIEKEGDLQTRLQIGMDNACKYYRRDRKNDSELDKYSRLVNLEELKNTAENQIKSSGYVVDTFEAAVWCLITTDSYAEAVLKAVNLGDDTDTVGAVTGGLAGLFYGYDAIPEEWTDSIQGKEWIDELLNGL